jgi:HrpA-like RNA helicase
VAFERGERCGDTAGYQVRLKARMGSRTRLLYCTTGILLRRLQSPGFLDKVSHVVIDEVHERQVETDFLMTLLKTALARQGTSCPLKVILMSATLQESAFSQYFGGCPVVKVSGRTFPVMDHYLEDCHSLVATAQQDVATSRGRGDADGGGGGRGRARGGRGGKGRGQGGGPGGGGGGGGTPAGAGRAPKFDADATAELVLAIVRKYSSVDRAALSRAPTEGPPGQAILVFLAGIMHIEKVSQA